ncbi:transglycosylase [Bacterioplanes sanyensis]|uniref:lytic transglycosylase domain-containing protein n=1 Tax=Bacterioplanes sanyensis TaxID=1249553 RepID=UPI00167A692C|nr:lytic transglycosylase domain-containing protein [Bacterioplanes sanyensis]GGY42681.1 transglycosylase [Bacterioplanes sanyensis]
MLRPLLLAILALMLGWPVAASASAKGDIDPELRQALRQAAESTDSFADRFEAEVWLVDISSRLKRYMPDDKMRLEFLRMVHQEATRAGLSPELVLSVIHVESAFQRFAISVVGAQGYMQIMPFWKNEIGRPDDNLMLTRTNLRYGCTILRHYLDKEKGDLIRALARYNGSLGRTKYPEKVLLFWEKYWFVNH